MKQLLAAALLVGAMSTTLISCEPNNSGQHAPDAMWTYKKVDGKELQLSVFLPDGYGVAKADQQYPAIVIFHGGSWQVGDASWHYPDCDYWSRRGMVAVSVDYRLKDRDNVAVPLECVKDAKSAVRFLRKNAARLKVDPNAIVAAGGSAGGHLAVALATLTNKNTNDAADDLTVPCKPNAIVLFNPWFKCQPQLSPPNFIVKGLPPIITFLGDTDPAIPVKEMKRFHDSLAAVGTNSSLFIGKGGKHGFCNGRNRLNPFFYWSLEQTDKFLVRHGVLSGASLVKIPDGVKQLRSEDYLVFRNDTKSEKAVSKTEPMLPVNPSAVEVPLKSNSDK